MAGRSADPQRSGRGDAREQNQQATREEQPGRTGIVADWRLRKDGTLFVLLEESALAGEDQPVEAGLTQDEVHRTWFKSPPIQGDQAHFKDLALIVVLQTHQRGSSLLRVTLWPDSDAARPDLTDRGKTREDAITFSMIGPG